MSKLSHLLIGTIQTAVRLIAIVAFLPDVPGSRKLTVIATDSLSSFSVRCNAVLRAEFRQTQGQN